MRRVAREEALVGLERERERRLEQRERTLGIAARAIQAAAFETDSHLRGGAVAGLGLRLLDEPLPGLEAPAQALDPGELRQDLGPALGDGSSASAARKRRSEASRSAKSQRRRR